MDKTYVWSKKSSNMFGTQWYMFSSSESKTEHAYLEIVACVCHKIDNPVHAIKSYKVGKTQTQDSTFNTFCQQANI